MDIPPEHGPEIARQRDGSYTLTMSTVLRKSRAEVFAALSDVRNVDRLTPPWVMFRVVTDPLPEMRQGTVFDYAVRIRWFRVKWRSEITEWAPPCRFTDTQTRGPFTEWRDRHTFTEVDPQTTLVENDITYRVPGGGLMHRLLVRRDLLRIYRHERLMMHEILNA